jgi:hypothetical protein
MPKKMGQNACGPNHGPVGKFNPSYTTNQQQGQETGAGEGTPRSGPLHIMPIQTAFLKKLQITMTFICFPLSSL